MAKVSWKLQMPYAVILGKKVTPLFWLTWAEFRRGGTPSPAKIQPKPATILTT